MSGLSGEEAVQIFTKHHVPPVTFVETGTHVGTTLEAISNRNAPDVVVVDDVWCFGRKWNDGPGGDWTAITEDSILDVFQDRVVESYVLDQKFVIHLRAEKSC